MSESPTSSETKRKASDEGGPRRKTRRMMDAAPEHSERIFTVKVGEDEEQKTFSIHESLLIKHSDFFEAALAQGEWKEQQERLLTLTEHDAATFALFRDFIYTGSIFTTGEDHGDDAAPNWDNEYVRFQKCWQLGEKLMSTSFKDAVTDALICKMVDEEQYPTALHEVIYTELNPRSAVRRLFVDVAIWGWSQREMVAYVDKEDKNVEFIGDVAVKLHSPNYRGCSASSFNVPFRSENTCHYHDHAADGKPCYRKMF